jgi:hypothetical protein
MPALGFPPRRPRHRSGRDVGERPIFLILKKEVGHRVVGHEDIRPAIVIDIGNRDAESVTAQRADATLSADVFERVLSPYCDRGRCAGADK